MGIKDLHPLLKKNCPTYAQPKHFGEYAYKKVAIDISLYLYKYKALAKSCGDPQAPPEVITSKWIGMFLDLICCLRAADIHPLFVYDGPAPPDKLIEQQRRRASVLTQKDKIGTLEDELVAYMADGSIGPGITKLMATQGPVSLFHPQATPHLRGSASEVNVKLVQEKILKMKSMVDISPTPQDILLTKQLFDLLEIPHVTPPDEAERYASQLCIRGKVDAVLSEDTDVLAYGTPVFLTKIDIRNGTVIEIRHDIIQEGLGMTSLQFTDLCILLGCDYNSNIHGYGSVNSLRLLREHGTIEGVIQAIVEEISKKTNPPPLPDTEVLRHVRCRELFSTPQDMNYYAPYSGVLMDFSRIDEFLVINNIRYSLDKLKRDIGPKKIIFDLKVNEN